MQLMIHNTGKASSNGSNGASTTVRPEGVTHARSLRSREVLWALERTMDEIADAALQIMSGTLPRLLRIEVSDTREAVVLSSALPGIDEESLEIAFKGRSLRIRGTTVEQRERSRRRYRRVEKVFRTFERTIPIHEDIDRSKTVATLRKEVLRIHVPKVGASREVMQTVPVTSDEPPRRARAKSSAS